MPQVESLTYITPGGTIVPVNYDLHAPGVRTVLSYEGTGMPPIEYVTQRGPAQHGESLIDFFLKPRIIQLLIRGKNCSRTDYWASRAELLERIRPNRQGLNSLNMGTLRWCQSDGTFRSIDCLIQDGPAFVARNPRQWAEWSWQEVLRFIAFNPIFYNPTLNQFTYVATASQLLFPITFPIQFSATNSSSNFTYNGTWPEYPQFIVSGPFDSFTVTNNTTGEHLTLACQVLAGENITITLTYGAKTVILGADTNKIGCLTLDSDLDTFHLEPHPGANNGVNNLTFTFAGAGGSTSVFMFWRDRYIGM